MSEGLARLAVVTGASRGIGHEIALALARAGWDVAFSHADETSAASDAVAAEIVALGRRALVRRCDAGVKDEVWAFFDAVVATFGRGPELLVNNAGVQTIGPLVEVAEADWERVIRTNLHGCFLNTQRAAQLMIEGGRGGVIINIGSGCNKVPFARLAAYTASKGGIEQLTKVAALELGPQGIRVNCVAPGAIELERTRAETPGYAEAWARVTPLRRVGTPADVAAAVLFLASDGAAYITGQTLTVDGGVFMTTPWPYEV